MWASWKPRLVSMAWGSLGIVLVLLALHLYLDHLAFHAIIGALQQSPVKPQ